MNTSPAEIAPALEALLLMATEPVDAMTLAEALGVPLEQVTEACLDLKDFYDESGRGFELRNVGGGWRLWTRPEHGELISRWVLEGQQSKLSQPALETLAVIAYLQPISRSRVSAVRGVNVDGVVRTLLSRGLVEEAEQEPDHHGPALFRTTDHFLERMGMESVDELPPLAPHLPDATDLESELARIVEVDPAAGPQAGPTGPTTSEDETDE
ncbi:SMC-Scp complex subunit ScpB [Aestuariimicrobium sp. p3-SID1156]|uniref:SMC-Scp complex subunit ScpB n=1 Tax=Aestuariimicrobium sp. p3-SID1156 TaxID=2916038 RepID=UPI00223A8F0B|nr:SMC-Scp complex subunit ScpB [Aestuariimicrobium sp. p3-SID1156]MCT1459150.1 SMC-Scp complex subunit ScpB [Aestuariimicrobium sp. p3-SID1156]